MPRKSAAALSTVRAFVKKAPEPPAELTKEQADLWRAVCATKPSDWFRADTFPLLSAYCQHTTSARRLSEVIDEFQPKWLKDEEGFSRYRDLLAARDRETRAMSSLARALRLTQQSRYTPQAAATASAKPGAGAARPWDF